MSFYTSLSGLKNAQTDLGVISHNIANAETGGFKKSRTEFADIVTNSTASNPRMTMGIGARVEAITQNFNQGPIEQTGSALNLAIDGNGFFATRSALSGDLLYTRDGNFSMDKDGFIEDAAGNRVQVFALDNNGDPVIGTLLDGQVAIQNNAGFELSGITVRADGHIVAAYGDGTTDMIGAVALASFTAPTGLKQAGSSNWQPTGLSGDPVYGVPGETHLGGLISGALERSNVDLAEEMVGLITAQRNFQANAKAIDTATQISQTIINLRS